MPHSRDTKHIPPSYSSSIVLVEAFSNPTWQLRFLGAFPPLFSLACISTEPSPEADGFILLTREFSSSGKINFSCEVPASSDRPKGLGTFTSCCDETR